MKTGRSFDTDKTALAFLQLAMMYLLAGLLFGVLGGLQYILPAFLKDALSFQKTRPLHVYLVISWIFTAAQAAIYYYLPRYTGRNLCWKKGAQVHLILQTLLSLIIIVCFFSGQFGGREYLEFPSWLGGLILISWVPFVINFFFTARPDYTRAPVYIWSWSTGIIFFFITMSESYLWVFDYFRTNIIRDTTVQWKALGSMVGSWNMLVYGAGMYVMEQVSRDKESSRKPIAFVFYFLGLVNLMFNWGHHTYIVPAAGWIKTVAYIISMTELLILAEIIRQFRKTLNQAQKNYHNTVYRFLFFADGWILLNLALALLISIPAVNYYTHGTHITVAHAMGATIGINSMLLLASVFYILKTENRTAAEKYKKLSGAGLLVTNISLLVFWISLLGSGIIKIIGKTNNKGFYEVMQQLQPWFRIFSFSGIVMMAGLALILLAAFRITRDKTGSLQQTAVKKTVTEQAALISE